MRSCGFFLWRRSGKVEYFTFQDSQTDVTKISLAFYSGLFAYNGWHNMPQMAEEMKEPQRQLPRALVLGMATVTVTYLLLNLSYLAVRTCLSPCHCAR